MKINKVENRQQFLELADTLDFTQPLAVRILPWSKSRTLEQNKMLWATYDSISKFLSDQSGKDISPQHVHEFCRARFAPLNDNPLSMTLGARRSTAQMTRQEFSDYFETVCAWAAEMGWFEKNGFIGSAND